MTHTEIPAPSSAAQEQIAACEQRRRATLSELKSARERAVDIAWELADVEYQVKELGEKRGADDQTEAQIAGLLSRRAALEEQSLAQMLCVDELTRRYEAEGQALSKLRGAAAGQA